MHNLAGQSEGRSRTDESGGWRGNIDTKPSGRKWILGGGGRELDETSPVRWIFFIPQVNEVCERRKPRFHCPASVSILYWGHFALVR